MGKNVVVEYERKFLVKEIPKDILLNKYCSTEIEQFYLGSKKDELCTRIRKSTKKDESRYYLMMKYGELKSHLEYTKEISSTDYCDLIKFKGKSIIINKTRYIIPSQTNINIKIELDIFHGNLKGLIIAEVEDVTGNTEIIDNYIPESWFSTELTTDPHFYNKNLAYQYKKPHRNFLLNLFRK